MHMFVRKTVGYGGHKGGRKKEDGVRKRDDIVDGSIF